MGKLIKLLNEYCKEKKYDTVWYEMGGLLKSESTKRLTQGVISGIVISKHYGFIERLVENDKISVLNIDNRIALSEYKNYERIIMYLAISDNPIQDLVELLKTDA